MNQNINTLLQNLTNDDRAIRLQAAEILSQLKDKAAMPKLIELLDHPNPDIRIIAAHTLGEIEKKTDIAKVPINFKASVRGFAGNVEGNMSLNASPETTQNTKYTPATISTSEIHQLINFLEDVNPFVRSIAASALSKIDSEITVFALSHRLKSETDTDVRLLMIQALVYLISTSKNEDICRQAAESLEKIDPGNETAIQTLEKLNDHTSVPSYSMSDG